MDDPEQYVLQILRRTQLGLQDSLIPVHSEKSQKLLEKFEQSSTLRLDLRRLATVRGFAKSALTMQWILERVEATGEEFSPDQFDQDVSALTDRMFEAFLNEPFESPDSAEAEPAAPAVVESNPFEEFGLPPVEQVSAFPVEEPAVEKAPASAAPPPPPPPPPQPPKPAAQPLSEILDQNLLLGFQRFADIVSKVAEKTPAERKSVFAVLGMISKSSADIARAQNKKEVLEFFQSVIKFISYVDSAGTTQDSRVAEIMKEIGAKLSQALTEKGDGAQLLQNITSILQNPQSAIENKGV